MGKYFNAKITKLVTYLATFLVAILISKNAYAETPTLSFSASSASNGGVVEMETLAPTSTSGAYTSGSDTLSIVTTCSAGHSVYVSATSDNSYGTNLVNSDDPNNTNGNSTIPTSSASIGSETALAGNMWGIRYGSGNTYAGLPAYSSDISGDITPIYTGTNTTIPIYYGINVTPTLAPGEYSGKVLYTVMMNNTCLFYTVHYDSNTGNDTVTGTMKDQVFEVGAYAAGTEKLNKNAFKREGYTFLGWADHADATEPTCEDEQVLDKDMADGGGEITLYAIWEADTPAFTNDTMQGFDCSTLAANTTTTLTDVRDNQKYTVYRFRTSGSAGSYSSGYPSGMQGYCIMSQDLKLGMVTYGDITAGQDLVLDEQTSEYNNAASNTSYETFNLSGPQTVLYSATIPSSGSSSYKNMRYTYGPATSSDNNRWGYYTWGAALVVCPKNWRVMTSSEHAALVSYVGGSNSTGVNRISSSPLAFSKGGFNFGSWLYVGTRGTYFSSTQTNNNARALALDISTSYLEYNYGDHNKAAGYSVRCITN